MSTNSQGQPSEFSVHVTTTGTLSSHHTSHLPFCGQPLFYHLLSLWSNTKYPIFTGALSLPTPFLLLIPHSAMASFPPPVSPYLLLSSQIVGCPSSLFIYVTGFFCNDLLTFIFVIIIICWVMLQQQNPLNFSGLFLILTF